MTNETFIGVIGATSLVGDFVLSSLHDSQRRVMAFSRQPVEQLSDELVRWRQLPGPANAAEGTSEVIEDWIFLAPVWVLPEYFDLLRVYGARRIVVLSSTSRFTKYASSNSEEQVLARVLEAGEVRLRKWAEVEGIEWVVLRSTMIYGQGRDKNISEIARFIKRFGFFPLFGGATGKRQPVHAADLAQACIAALDARHLKQNCYNVSGGEVLPYREMVIRIFAAMGRKPRLLNLPLWMFKAGVACLHLLPRSRSMTSAMAERMQFDMHFPHAEAANDFHFAARPFCLAKDDLPI